MAQVRRALDPYILRHSRAAQCTGGSPAGGSRERTQVRPYPKVLPPSTHTVAEMSSLVPMAVRRGEGGSGACEAAGLQGVSDILSWHAPRSLDCPHGIVARTRVDGSPLPGSRSLSPAAVEEMALNACAVLPAAFKVLIPPPAHASLFIEGQDSEPGSINCISTWHPGRVLPEQIADSKESPRPKRCRRSPSRRPEEHARYPQLQRLLRHLV